MEEVIFANNIDQYLGSQKIIKIGLKAPQIIIELESFFKKLDLEPVITSQLLMDNYLKQQDLSVKPFATEIDISLPLAKAKAQLREQLKSKEEIANLSEYQTEKLRVEYSPELISKGLSFEYQGYRCEVLFSDNYLTRIWEFGLSIQQLMHFRGRVYATKLAIEDFRQGLLRVLNPELGIELWQQLMELQSRYDFSIEVTGLNMLIDYIYWLGNNISSINILAQNLSRAEKVFTGRLREYYYRWLNQQKSTAKSLLTYLLMTDNYQNPYLSELLGSYNFEYNSNFSYRRFLTKAKDLKFKVITQMEDRQDLQGGSLAAADQTNYLRVTSILDILTGLEFREFMKGRLNKEQVAEFHKYHSPKLGKILVDLKSFIEKLDLTYYSSYIFRLCTDMLALFNSRGPDNRTLEIVISQSAEDLLAVSTDQNWSSCLKLPSLGKQRVSAARVAANLHPATLVAYIKEPKQEQWLGRSLIRLLRNGDLILEKYYGEPILEELLEAKVKEVIEEAGYKLSNAEQGLSLNFIEWKPYSDQGRVQSLKQGFYQQYYIDYSLSPLLDSKFKSEKIEDVILDE
ncbi:hypothetical protein [Fuchsiella alkaliacetigena]|uniref:hypothetical protein n=1 Tax=Fuchsiella alkaliacetigena TaxID=957042 RepID=UPI00200A7E0C|nr:hypothetical protein [Fuchsiella alkaliacetigena]MCK8824490.1 hypothetical protein [Fuchsiella alkaliacetigena]